MATIYFTASSIDGYIVDDRDSLDWLLSRNIDADGPFGYRAFSESVGALVLGATTYEWIVANEPGEWMYEQPSWVLTHRPDIVRPGHPVHTYHGDITELHGGSWGGRLPGRLGGRRRRSGRPVRPRRADRRADRQLRPCTLGTGGRLLPAHTEWKLVESGVNGDFVCARWRKA